MSEKLTSCSFCHKHKTNVKKLIVGSDVAICNECVDLCSNLLSKDPKTASNITASKLQIPDPREIRDYLDKFVIGQDEAKVVIAVAIANHYKRISSPGNEIVKSNILLLGPTGTGKTLLAKTVAEYLDVPFVIADATSLTEAGYVGDDVENMISRLYQAAEYDVEKTQRGIVFIDEVDKIARKGESATVSRDVSGEGVQQALLKLVEGTKCKINTQGNKKNHGDMIDIDTSNILFIAGGAFVGMDDIVKKRVQGTSIGFGAELHDHVDPDKEQITSDDLTKYGLIPEFIGRFSNIVSLHGLTKEQLISILTEVKHNFVDQYRWLFDKDGVELDFDRESLDLIAERTLETKTGARGLHTELERVLLPHMFDLPRYKKQNIIKVVIHPEQVNTPTTLLQENS